MRFPTETAGEANKAARGSVNDVFVCSVIFSETINLRMKPFVPLKTHTTTPNEGFIIGRRNIFGLETNCIFSLKTRSEIRSTRSYTGGGNGSLFYLSTRTGLTSHLEDIIRVIIVLSPLDSSVPNQARLLSHSACFIGKLSHRTMLEHHHKLNSPSAHVCMQQSLTNAVTYYLLRYDQYRFITPPPSLSRRQCGKLQRTILPRMTNRHECRHPLPYSSLRSSPVNYAPPAL